MGSRIKNARRNIWTGVLNKIVTLALPFVIRTIIIQKLGFEYLGLGSLYTSILQVLSMAELGFSSAVVFSLYKPLAENNETEICALMAFYRKIYRIVGSVICIVGILLLPFLKFLIKGSYPDTINIYVLYLIFLANTVVSYFVFAYKNVLLTASQRQDLISNIDTILGLIRSILQIIVLLVWKNYYIYTIVIVLFTVVNNIVIAYITKKMYPQYVCRGKLNHNNVETITTQIKGLAIGKFSVIARNSFDSIVLSMFCGLVDVAIYSNYYYVFNSIIGFITVLIQALTAGIGNSVAVETVKKNYEDFKKLYFVMSWLGAWCTVCLLCLYQPFMKMWAGDKFVASFPIVILFCIYFYITQMGQVRSMYANAAGLWWEFRNFEIAEMIGNIILNFTLGYFFGMLGILIATIVTVFLCSIIGLTNVTYKCYFRCSSKYFYLESFKYIIITCCVSAVTYFICNLIHVSELPGLVIKGVICLIIPNLLISLMLLWNKRYRTYIIDIFNSFFSKR